MVTAAQSFPATEVEPRIVAEALLQIRRELGLCIFGEFGLSESDLIKIANVFPCIVFNPGDVVQEIGEAASWMGLILTGALQSFSSINNPIGELRSGDPFGLSNFVSAAWGNPILVRTLTYKAKTNGCFLAFSHEKLELLSRVNPGLTSSLRLFFKSRALDCLRVAVGAAESLATEEPPKPPMNLLDAVRIPTLVGYSSAVITQMMLHLRYKSRIGSFLSSLSHPSCVELSKRCVCSFHISDHKIIPIGSPLNCAFIVLGGGVTAVGPSHSAHLFMNPYNKNNKEAPKNSGQTTKMYGPGDVVGAEMLLGSRCWGVDLFATGFTVVALLRGRDFEDMRSQSFLSKGFNSQHSIFGELTSALMHSCMRSICEEAQIHSDLRIAKCLSLVSEGIQVPRASLDVYSPAHWDIEDPTTIPTIHPSARLETTVDALHELISSSSGKNLHSSRGDSSKSGGGCIYDLSMQEAETIAHAVNVQINLGVKKELEGRTTEELGAIQLLKGGSLVGEHIKIVERLKERHILGTFLSSRLHDQREGTLVKEGIGNVEGIVGGTLPNGEALKRLTVSAEDAKKLEDACIKLDLNGDGRAFDATMAEINSESDDDSSTDEEDDISDFKNNKHEPMYDSETGALLSMEQTLRIREEQRRKKREARKQAKQERKALYRASQDLTLSNGGIHGLFKKKSSSRAFRQKLTAYNLSESEMKAQAEIRLLRGSIRLRRQNFIRRELKNMSKVAYDMYGRQCGEYFANRVGGGYLPEKNNSFDGLIALQIRFEKRRKRGIQSRRKEKNNEWRTIGTVDHNQSTRKPQLNDNHSSIKNSSAGRNGSIVVSESGFFNQVDAHAPSTSENWGSDVSQRNKTAQRSFAIANGKLANTLLEISKVAPPDNISTSSSAGLSNNTEAVYRLGYSGSCGLHGGSNGKGVGEDTRLLAMRAFEKGDDFMRKVAANGIKKTKLSIMRQQLDDLLAEVKKLKCGHENMAKRAREAELERDEWKFKFLHQQIRKELFQAVREGEDRRRLIAYDQIKNNQSMASVSNGSDVDFMFVDKSQLDSLRMTIGASPSLSRGGGVSSPSISQSPNIRNADTLIGRRDKNTKYTEYLMDVEERALKGYNSNLRQSSPNSEPFKNLKANNVPMKQPKGKNSSLDDVFDNPTFNNHAIKLNIQDSCASQNCSPKLGLNQITDFVETSPKQSAKLFRHPQTIHNKTEQPASPPSAPQNKTVSISSRVGHSLKEYSPRPEAFIPSSNSEDQHASITLTKSLLQKAKGPLRHEDDFVSPIHSTSQNAKKDSSKNKNAKESNSVDSGKSIYDQMNKSKLSTKSNLKGGNTEKNEAYETEKDPDQTQYVGSSRDVYNLLSTSFRVSL